MTRFNTQRAILLGCLCLATAAFAAGCSSHTDEQAPPGMAVGAPLTPAQVAAANQVAANRHARQNTAPGP